MSLKDPYPGRNHQKNVDFYVHLNGKGSHCMWSIILKTYQVFLDACGQRLVFVSYF